MTRTGVFIMALLTLYSCGSFPPAPELVEDFWQGPADSGGLVFYGAAAPRRDPEESVRRALEDAARRAAMFNLLRGQSVSRSDTGSGPFDNAYAADSSLVHDRDYQKYIDAFTFDPEKDVLRRDNLVFVRVLYPVSPPADLPLVPHSGDGDRPPWIDNPPSFPGRHTGLGHAGKRASPADTFKASYESAALSIIRAVSTEVRGSVVEAQGSGAFAASRSAGQTISAEAVLREFYILDFWIDPADQSIWTLAAARAERG
jgi:hypothetical protein